MKKDCMHCKHCVIKIGAYTKARINTCSCEDDLSKMSMEELLQAIRSGICKQFEPGEPVWTNEITFDD